MISKLIIFSALAVLTSGQAITFGPCPNVTVVENFDVVAYLGKWYQLARIANAFEEGNCSTALYGPIEDGLVRVHNVEIINGVPSSIDGTAELANPNSTEAKLIVKFFNPDTAADYWVLATDYDNYSVVWACQESSSANAQFAWILAREKPLAEEYLDEITQVLIDNEVNPYSFDVHDLPECEIQP